LSFSGGGLNLGALTLDVTVNTAGADSAFARLGQQSRDLGNAFATVGKNTSDLGGAFTSAGRSATSFGDTLRQSVVVGAAFEVGVLAMRTALRGLEDSLKSVISASVGWQTTLNETRNNTVMTTADIQQMDESIRTMAAHSPADMGQLAAGFRHATDEGFNLADSQKIVEAAMKSATSTGADTGKTVDAISTILHDYHLNADDAAKATDMWMAAAKSGNTTVEKLVTSGNQSIAMSAAFGVSLRDTAGAFATLTQNGFTAQGAAAAYGQTLLGITKPSKSARDELERLTKASGIDLVSAFTPAGLAANGFANTMEMVNKATGGAPGEIEKILPSLRAIRGGLVLAGNGADDYRAALQAQDDVVSGKSHPTQEAYNRTLETAGAQFKILQNTITLLAIQLGTVLMPVIHEIISGLTQLGQAIGQVFNVPGLDNIQKHLDDTKASTEAATEATSALSKEQVDGGTAAADAAQKVATATAHTGEALDTARAAAASLNNALGLPNGATGPGGATQSLASLEQMASGDAARALANLNTLLQLPDGQSGPANAAAAMGDLRVAAEAVSLVIHQLDRDLASVKSALDAVHNQQAAVHDQYDPIMKTAQEAMAANDRPNYARLGQEASLAAEHARLAIDKPDVSQYTESIKGYEAQKAGIAEAQTGRNSGTGGYDDQIAAKRSSLEQLGKFDENGQMADAIKAAQAGGQATSAAYAEQVRQLQEAGAATTAAYAEQVRQLQEAGRGASQSFDDIISGLRDKSSHLGEGATDGVDKQIATLREAIASLNTNELDDQINKLRENLNQPAPNTTGITRQLVALQAQIQGTTDATKKAALIAQYNSLSGQKEDMTRGYQERTAGDKLALKALEDEKRETVLANREARKADEAKIVGLAGERKAILDGITDGKKALADQIVGQEHLKKVAAEATAADIRGVQEKGRLAAEANKADIHAVQERGRLAAVANKTEVDHLTHARSEAERAFKARQEAINDEIKGIETTKAAGDRADKLQTANLDAQIRGARTLSDNLMAPWLKREADNLKASEALKLLDDQDKAARDIANLPLHKVYDDAKLALDKALVPLLAQQHSLETQQRTLGEEKTRWQEIATAINTAKTAADTYAKAVKAGVDAAKGSGVGGGAPTKPGLGTNNTENLPIFGPPAPPDENQFIAPMQHLKDFLTGQVIPALKAAKTAVDEFFIGWNLPPDFVGPLTRAEEAGRALHGVLILLKAAVDDFFAGWNLPPDFVGPLTRFEEAGKNVHAMILNLKQAIDDFFAGWKLSPDFVGPLNRAEAAGRTLHTFLDTQLGPRLAALWKDIKDNLLPALGELAKVLPLQSLPEVGAVALLVFVDSLKTGIDNLTNVVKLATAALKLIGDGLVVTKDVFKVFFDLMTLNMPALQKDLGLLGNDGSKFLSAFGTAASALWSLVKGLTFVGPFEALMNYLGQTFPGIAGAVEGPMQAVLDAVGGMVHGVQHAINAIGGLFGNATLGGTDWPVPSIGTSSPPGGVGPPAPLGGATAEGTANWKGGVTLIGEAGRELYAHGGNVYLADRPMLLNLPAGAQVFKNSDTERMLAQSATGARAGISTDVTAASLKGGMPQSLTGMGGPAEVWNDVKSHVGNFFSGAGSTAQSAKSALTAALAAAGGKAEGLVKGAFDAAGVSAPSLPGVLGNIGGGMLDTLTKTVVEGVKGLLGLVPGGGSTSGAFGGGSGMANVRGLIDMEARRHSIPEDVLAAIVYQESSGIVGRIEDGGGLGRGLMQVDLGQNPGYDEKRLTGTTWDDAMYQMESGIAILNRNAPRDWSDPGQLREALYHYNGSYAYSDIIKNLMPQFADWKNDGVQSATASGGDNATLAAALSYVGTPGPSRGWAVGRNWDLLCETFEELVREDRGFGYPGYATAADHGRAASGSLRRDGIPSPGSVGFWDESFYPGAGHTAIAMGDGTWVSTGGPNVSRGVGGNWMNSSGFMGYAPISAANGAVTTTPTVLLTGDIGNHVPEITAPQPMMADTFRAVLAERGGGGVVVNFGEGSIVAPPGTDPRQFARDVVAVITTELDKHLGARGR